MGIPQAIAKFLKAEFEVDNKLALKKALQKGEKSGQLVRTGQSFKVAGDAAYEPEPGSTVETEDVKVGDGAEAQSGSTVVVAYRGTLAATGEKFDAGRRRVPRAPSPGARCPVPRRSHAALHHPTAALGLPFLQLYPPPAAAKTFSFTLGAGEVRCEPRRRPRAGAAMPSD